MFPVRGRLEIIAPVFFANRQPLTTLQGRALLTTKKHLTPPRASARRNNARGRARKCYKIRFIGEGSHFSVEKKRIPE